MILPLLVSLLPKHGAIIVANSLPISNEQLSDFSALCGDRRAQILVVHVEKESSPARDTVSACFKNASFSNVTTIYVDKGDSAQKEVLENQLNRAAGVVVAGTESGSILRMFDRDWCQRVFSRFLERGGNWFGVGAGATIVGDRYLSEHNSVAGLSLFDGIVTVDYYAKHQEVELRNAYFGSRLQLGIGLNKGEWMIFRDGIIEKKVGSPQVFLRE